MGSGPEGERRVGGYRLERRLAVGGMAEIFEARRESGGPLVVVKLLLPQYARDPEIETMLRHEAELQERLSHPGLVRVLEHGEHDGQPFVVMERVDGVSLAELLTYPDVPALPRDAALFVIRQVLAVLGYVHDATGDDGAPLHVVHRDVTPQNILVSRDGDVLLGDFGIARSSLRDARTRTGVIKGKLRYLAPEQVTGSAIDARTDLYSLGVVAFELLTGEPYLEGDSEIELLRAAENPPLRGLSEHLEDVDPRLDRLLRRVLSRFPEERPSSARAIESELEVLDGSFDEAAARRVLGSRVATVAREKGIAPAPRPVEAPPRESRGMRAAHLVGFVVAASALALGVGLLWSASEERGSVAEVPVAHTDDAEEGAPDPGDSESTEAPARAEAVVEVVEEAAPEETATPEVSEPTRTRRARTPPATDSPPADAVDSPNADAELRAALETRLGALRQELRRRGVREDDLDAALRGRLAGAATALSQDRLAEAERAIEESELAARAVSVDGDFVRRKIERVDAAIRRASARGADTARVQELSASALSDFMGGRHEAANRRLNQILDAL